MALFKRKKNSRVEGSAKDPLEVSELRESGTLGRADIGYQRLEQRQVLSASFIAGAGGIFLDGFDPNQDLLLGQVNTGLNGALQDSYLFVLDSGSWTGSTADPLVELESVNGGTNNRLEVATSLFGTPGNAQISIDGSTSGTDIEFNQVSSLVTFDSLTISNFTNFDRSFQLIATGDIFASDIHVLDSNPNDNVVPNGDLRIETLGSIITGGVVENQITNFFSDIVLNADGINNDVTVAGDLLVASGNINIESDDAVLFTPSGSVVSSGSGDIFIQSGLGSSVGDSLGEIRMDDGSSIQANQGVVNLMSPSNVFLSTVSSNATNNAVSVFADGGIFDNTPSESENALTPNGRLRLFANGDIGTGGDGDVDIESRFLQFDTDGLASVHDLGFGLTIDRTSRADAGATIASNSFLTISRNINVGADSTFSSGNGNDDLLINNNAVVTLDSAVDSRLEFLSGDDIEFDNGRIVTIGANHTVVLTADLQGSTDADRGKISNSTGVTSVTTAELIATSFDGIGDSNQPLRINVDRLTAFDFGTGDIVINETDSIELVDVRTEDGTVVIEAGGNIEATNVMSGENESSEDNADNVELTSRSGSITTTNLTSADDLLLTASFGGITDNIGGQIVVAGDAQFTARDLISVSNDSSDLLSVTGNASFEASTIQVGRDFQAAGNASSANVFLGSVTLNADTAILVEDDATLFQGSSTVGNLFVASADQITNSSNTDITVSTHAQLNAPNQVVLGENGPSDNIDITEVGLVTTNAHLEFDTSVVINGRAPNQSPVAFGLVASQGTEVSDTLYVTSTNSVIQNAGLLNVGQLGIEASEHVHLVGVSPANNAIAISAGTASELTDPNQIAELNGLSNVVNSEVNSAAPQTIAIKHQGQLNSTSVSSHLGTHSSSGISTTDGSVFVSAKGNINLLDDISANSATTDPQVTAYSELGNASNPAIQFAGGVIKVNGPENIGIVNANQTTATFFDADEEVLKGTTEILLLNTDGSADQDIVVDYGHTGETGYRVGIVWDRDNSFGQPVEVINTYVADPNTASEAYEDTVYQTNPNTFLQIGGNEGGRETFAKVERYSKDAIIAHSDEPKVFSTVTVRNDQDINLFTGTLSATSNSLNEISQTLRAELDAPKKFAADLPSISEINSIEVKSGVDLPVASSSPDSSSGLTFGRDVQAFESGDLKWVQVKVPIEDLEEIEGDVRLKDPTKVFKNAEDSEVNELDEEIGDNEVEKIIESIETNKKAESGYWYKVFKDYRNRDDELFFYHYKTGEPQQADEGPTTDLQSGREHEPSLQGAEPTKSPQDTESNSQEEIQEFKQPNADRLFNPFEDPSNAEPSLDSPESEGQQISPDATTARSLSAGSLMAAAMLLNQKSSSTNATEESSAYDDTKPNNFSRLARLKRKIKKLLT